MGEWAPPPEVRRQLLRVAVSLLAVGWATKHVLQQALGLYMFHHMFKFLEDLNKFGLGFRTLFVMSETAMHLCILTANLRAEPLPEAYATDATPTRGGAIIANLPPILARALYRVAESRGASVRLDGGLQHEAEAKLLQ